MARTKDKKGRGSIYGRLFPLFAKDADPEEIQAVVEAVEEVMTPETPADEEPTQTAPADNEPPPAKDDEMPPWAQALINEIAQLKASLAPRDDDPIQQLEKELEGGEGAVTKPAEEIDENPAQDEDPPTSDEDPTTDDEDPVADEETQDEDIDPAQDEECGEATTDSLLKLVRAMKPVIAGIQNPKAKKRATDALTKTVRDLRGQPKRKGVNGYAGILDARRDTAKKRTRDAKGVGFDLSRQQAIYDSLNPHMKKKEGR